MTRIKSEEVKAIAREEGVDMVGIASADCVETTPLRRGPWSALPEARSVVVFAKRMLTGSIESPSKPGRDVPKFGPLPGTGSDQLRAGLFL